MSYASIELEGIQELLLQHADEPQKLLNCAKDGSLVSLHALVSYMQSDKFPSRQLPKAVDSLVSVLRQHRKHPFEYDVIPVCVQGLATLQDVFYEGRKVLAQKVMHCWPLVREWIEHAGYVALKRQCCDGQVLETIENALKAFSVGRVMEEDAILTLSTQIWLSCNSRSSSSRQVARPAFAVVSLDVIRSSARLKATIPLLHRICAKALALGWSVESLMEILTKRLRSVPQMAQLDEPALCHTLDDVHHLLKSLLIIPSVAQGPHTISLTRGVIRRVLCLLRNIISSLAVIPKADHNSLALKSASTFSMGIWVMSYLFSCTSGVSFIRQAIKHGLFGVLESAMTHLDLLRRAQHSGQEAIEFLFANVLRQAFTFRSVVVTAHRYLRKWMDACGPVCQSCGLPSSLADSDLHDAWDMLFCRLRHQVLAYRFFSKCLKAQNQCCENPSCLCDGKHQLTEIRKCAGCKSALFCSSHCQRVAWKAYHKAECAQARKRLASSGLSAHDARFLALVAHEEVRQSLNDVVFNSKCREDQRIQKEYPASCRGFTVDYTKPKPEVHQFAFETRNNFDPSVPLPTVITLGKTSSSSSTEDEQDHSTGSGDVKPDETLRTTLEIIYPFGSETRTMYVAAEFNGSAYHGYECTCCRYHVDDPTKEANTSCSAHEEEP